MTPITTGSIASTTPTASATAATSIASMDRIVAIGRWYYAVSLIAFGLYHLVYGNFVTRVVISWPAWIPGRALWPYLVGVLLIVVGLAILANRQARPSALLFGGLMLLSFVFLSLPVALTDVLWGGLWTSAGKALVISGGAFAVAGSLRPDARFEALARFIPIARFCLGAFMVLCGIQHFVWAVGVSRLVPAWFPPGQLFWTYFAGVALIAGGLGLMVRKVAPLAAMLSGLMIFAWVFLVHIPLALADVRTPFATVPVFEALGFSGIAFILAGTLQRERL